MKVDLRHTFQHLGDIVVEAVEKTINTANKCAQGVASVYDVRELQKKKKVILAEIGERLTQVTKEGLVDVRRDDKLMDLFSKLAAMEKSILANKCCNKEKAASDGAETKVPEMNVAESAAS